MTKDMNREQIILKLEADILATKELININSAYVNMVSNNLR